MSFSDYLKETNDIVNLIMQINKVGNNIADTYKSLIELRDLATNKTGSLLGNINLGNMIDKLEMKLKEIGDLTNKLQSAVDGDGTVGKTNGNWGGWGID